MYHCPHCKKPAIPLVKKMIAGPAVSFRCHYCGEWVQTSWWGVIALALLLIPIAQMTGSIPLSLLFFLLVWPLMNAFIPLRKSHPSRLRILYLLLLILIGVSVIPLGFYGWQMVSTNQDTLETKEKELQAFTSESLAQEVSLSIDNVRQRVSEFFDSVVPLAVQIRASQYGEDPRLRVTLQRFANEEAAMIYVTVVNNEERGAQAGRYDASADAFLQKALDAAFLAAHQGAEYQSNPITIMRSGQNEPVMLFARPIEAKGNFLGMMGAVVTLEPILKRLQDTRTRTGLDAYIVDNSGRLVATNEPEKNVAGRDMVAIPIVQKFLAWRGEARLTETSDFNLREGNKIIPMLGTYSPIQNVGWGIIVQRKQSDAYFAINQMRQETMLLGFLVILLSLG